MFLPSVLLPTPIMNEKYRGTRFRHITSHYGGNLTVDIKQFQDTIQGIPHYPYNQFQE